MNARQRKALADAELMLADPDAAMYKIFLEKLSATPRDWFLDGKPIRTLVNGEKHCPLTFVANTADISRFAQAGALLGLDVWQIQQVVAAADGTPGPVRNDLLQACGLAEQATTEQLQSAPLHVEADLVPPQLEAGSPA